MGKMNKGKESSRHVEAPLEHMTISSPFVKSTIEELALLTINFLLVKSRKMVEILWKVDYFYRTLRLPSL